MNKINIIYTILLLLLLLSCKSNKHEQLFVMKSDTMLPTINVDDEVLIDLQPKTFTYGDIVVYRDTCYEPGRFCEDIYRIVALPGDSIAVENDICIVNGKKNIAKYIRTGDFNDKYEEILPNGMKITIYYYPIPTEFTDGVNVGNFKAIKVPKDHYFLMADRRSGSLDSRYFGPVPRKIIIGKVIEIIKQDE